MQEPQPHAKELFTHQYFMNVIPHITKCAAVFEAVQLALYD